MSVRLFKTDGASSAPAFAPYTFPVADQAQTSHSQSPHNNSQTSGEHEASTHSAAHTEAEVSAQADDILSRAQAEAARIIAEAQAAAASIEQAAQERGLAHARQLADAELTVALEPVSRRFAETFAELEALRAHLAAEAEADLVRLALEIARKIVRRETSVDPDIALTLARVALSRLNNATTARVHLNPEDHVYVSAQDAKLGGASVAVALVEDATIERGGCLIHTDMGDIDARIEQQFAEVERGFFKG